MTRVAETMRPRQDKGGDARETQQALAHGLCNSQTVSEC